MRKTTITRDQSRDTGMAMVLLMLLGLLAFARNEFLIAAIVLHLVNMIAPQLFRPVAVVWFGLSHAIGFVMSRLLLSIVYLLVVTPVGLLRRVAGKDSLRLRAFRTSDDSVMVARNHRFAAGDLEKPY
ncbi:MAG TPA: SxtJ family membrane protein [Vicinamibacterales bacterium]|nr:SxtJ family membrane protein [Vicinamibacterales bacterium]